MRILLPTEAEMTPEQFKQMARRDQIIGWIAVSAATGALVGWLFCGLVLGIWWKP